MSTPQTTIYICSGVRLNSKYEHSIYFANASEQRSYFAGKVVKTLSAYSYVRRSWKLKVAATMSDALKWNYLYFRNATSDPSFFYFFINNVEYINDETVELDLELDVIQTYLFRFELLPCFVERQHVEVDEIGSNTVDEGLEFGEYVNKYSKDLTDLNDLAVMAMSTYNLLLVPPDDPSVMENSLYWCYFTMLNGVYSKLGVFTADASEGEQQQLITEFLDKMDDAGIIDSIVTMWMFPKALVLSTPHDSEHTPFETVEGTHRLEYAIKPDLTTIDGYTPQNQKLFCYPYSFLYGTNNAGTTAVYRFERSEQPDRVTFLVDGSCTPDGGVRAYPKNYNGIAYNYDEGLTIANYPTCAWDSDPYKLWLAQNQNQLGVASATNGLKIVAGTATAIAGAATANPLVMGAGATMLGSGVSGVVDTLAMKADKNIEPPQARGMYSASVNVANKKQTFTFIHKTIDANHAKIIDDFFTVYGYRINEIKVPNIHARESFTFIKTKGCHAVGNICNSDILAIENIFDKGVTFWTDGDSVGNYNLPNNGLGN
jgi:hypothetical protein